MAFNDFACYVKAFYAVGVNSALGEPFGIGYFLCFGIKYVNEAFANDFTFLFGFGYTGKLFEEFFAGIHTDNVEAEAFIVMKNIVEFVLSQQAVIYKYASEVPADGAMQ